MPLTKKDLKQIKDVVVEATEPYFTAIKDDFNNVDDRFNKIDEKFRGIDENFKGIDENFKGIDENFNDIRSKLSSLERRIIAIEDIATEHGKELRKIRVILTQLKKQKKVDQEKVILLEKRVARVEAMAG